MADSDRSNLTKQERKLVREILTRVWLSMSVSRTSGKYWVDELADGPRVAVADEHVCVLAEAINKI